MLPDDLIPPLPPCRGPRAATKPPAGRRKAVAPLGGIGCLLWAGLVASACLGGGTSESGPAPTDQGNALPTATLPGSGTPEPEPTAPLPLTNAPTYLEVPTYDGSGQAVHPDVAFFPDGWRGYPYWMVMTPYPYDTGERENPSILVSGDGLSWAPPPGVENPLVPPPPCDHNSDPDIVYNPDTDRLYLYYTEARRSSSCGAGENENHVKLITSGDGVQWTAPQTVMSFDLDSSPFYVSPSVAYRDGVFHLWLASSENSFVHATSTDGVNWSPPEALSMTPMPWHVDVAYVEPEAEYWMLFVDSPDSGANLRFARSEDGLNWSVCEAPVLRPGPGWDNERVYRATFLYGGEGLLRVWYSARSQAAEWHIGYTEGTYPGLGGPGC